MKILITGGLGFIGFKLSNFLKQRGYVVHILDKKDPTLLQKNNFKCFTFDMCEKEKFISLDKNYDYIFHLAAQSGGYYSLKNPQDDCLWNCLATINLVEYCKIYKPKKILFSSSMAVYGNGKKVKENSSLSPISFYGVSKLASENYIKLLLEHSNISYTIFRLFATYGSGQDLENMFQGIVSIYLKHALDNNFIPITGKKDRVRSLVHVNDVCEAFLLGITNQKTDNQIFNVLYDEDQTPEKIIKIISKALNKKINIEEKEGYIGDQTYITGTNKKLLNIGWDPKYNLKEGIKEFCASVVKK